VEWDIDDTAGLGVMPGETGVFSFTSLPRFITNSTGWFHTWEFDVQAAVTFYTDTAGELGPEVPDVLRPPIGIPEQESILLLAEAFGAVFLTRRKRSVETAE
jgi:hypothetical protein